jgi:hypothetical protein
VMFPCLSIAFRKQTWPNIREHRTGKGSGHNEHHEKVNKRQTLVEKDT